MKVLFTNSLLYTLFTVLFINVLPFNLNAQTNLSGTINRYSKVTALDIAQNSATLTEPANFRVCDTVLLIQMQGAAIDITNTPAFGNLTNYGSAGLYEKCIIEKITGNQAFFRHKLLNTYSIAGNVQLVTLPQFADVNIVSSLTGKNWDGNTGGVIAFEASGIVRISGLVNAAGIGFRGGRTNVNAACAAADATNQFYANNDNIAGLKGEGIVILDGTNGSGRGSAANGGGAGNCRNGGGGGGSNAGAGGIGGKSPKTSGESTAVSGAGGRLLVYANNTARIFMGGGGGGGNQDDNTGTSGGNGGGIVYISASQIVGGGLINASGSSAEQAGIDGAGGGGAGGSVLLQSRIRPLALSVLATGGNGGNNIGISANNTISTDCFATGGGGGGGSFWTNGNANGVTLSIEGGNAGRIVSNLSTCANSTYGAANGSLGQSLSATNLMPAGTVEQIPLSATVTAPAPSCTATQISLIATTIAGATYQWQKDGIDLTGQDGIALTVTTSGIYRLKVTSGCNVALSTDQIVVLNNQPFAFIYGATNQQICGNTGSSVTLLAAQSPLYTYQWRRNGADIAGATSPLFTATSAGVYTVAITACTNTAVSNAITLAIPAVVTPVVSGSNLLCAGGSTRLTASPANAFYQWRLNGVNIAGAFGNVYEATAIGDYTVINSNACNPNPSNSFIVQLSPNNTTINITGNLQACQGNKVRLTATSGLGFAYQWFLNGQTIANATTNPYEASVGGDYRVQVTNGCNQIFNSATVKVSIISSPADIFIRGQALLCQGTAPMSVRSVRTYRYQWFSNGAEIAGATDTAFVARQPAGYYVSVKDTCNNEYFTPTFFVNDGSLDQAQLSINDGRKNICPGDRIVLTATSSFGLNLQWQLNGQDIPSALGNTFTASQAGVYTVKAFNSCTSKVSAPYIINAVTPPPASISGILNFCVGERTNLSANTGQGFTYQWIRNDSLLVGAITSSIPVFIGGQYKVAITNAQGCRTISDAVTVVANTIDLNLVRISPSALICAGNTTQLSAAGGTRYEWTPTTGLNNPNIANPIASPTASTFYNVKIINAFGCSTIRSTFVEVIPEFTLDFDLQLSGDCGERSLIRIENKSKGLNGFNNITWTMGDGTTIQGFTPPPYTYEKGGFYTITLRVDNRGCVKTLSKRIEFENFFYPTVITPNGDGKNEKFMIDNPDEAWKLQVFDRSGRLVFESENYNNDWAGENKSGMYYYRLVSPSGKECKSWCYVML
jgi:gliding motility-associated-like protein